MTSDRTHLYDVACQHLLEISAGASEDDKEFARGILKSYIAGDIDFDSARTVFQTKFGSTTPVDRVRDILAIPDEPLPPFPVPIDGRLRRKTQQWTVQEDNRLIAGLHQFGQDNWSLIARFVGNNRTRSQCSQRWQRGLDPRISRDHWTKEEEEGLLQRVASYGMKSWIRIAKELGIRSDVQCRYRYLQIQKEGYPEAIPPTPDVKIERTEKANPPVANIFDGILWDNDESLSMKAELAFECMGSTFFDLPWSLD
jgi:hypothetical protein